ncbi:MAG: FkbM family methyltransferase [Euryarchaeota archaeon]|jgi:FkbM family methyltransferase|uniref:FkbM family methyltransferase n=1 Tax=Methanobacterium sp. MZD130B TaxID=3394378 RepID=UPI0039FD91A4|nr:FkbM family methyltransferase [Euryarchaeota archaeon]
MKKMVFLALCKVSRFSSRFLEKIPVLITIRDICYYITNPNELVLIKVMNKKMYVNSNDIGIAYPLLKSGIYEEYETETFKNLLQSNTIFIDIGANIGYYTLIAASKIKDGQIYSFEPVKANYKLLTKNIKINNINNVKAFQKAISNRNGKIKIFIDGTNLGNHSLAKNNVIDKTESTEVETIRLDSFFNNLEEIIEEDFLIKIDTQGAEGLIVEGAHNLLLNKNIKILMEFWPKGLRNTHTDPLELLNKLQGYGFNLQLLDEKTKSLKIVNKNEVIDFCDNTKGVDQVNLLLEKGN